MILIKKQPITKTLTTSDGETLQQVLRNSFDASDNLFHCQKIIRLSERIGLVDLAEEMKNDLDFELKT